jgi:hypothetical protein
VGCLNEDSVLWASSRMCSSLAASQERLDAIFQGVLGLTVYACWHAWGPDGLMVPGVMFFVLGVMLEWLS